MRTHHRQPHTCADILDRRGRHTHARTTHPPHTHSAAAGGVSVGTQPCVAHASWCVRDVGQVAPRLAWARAYVVATSQRRTPGCRRHSTALCVCVGGVRGCVAPPGYPLRAQHGGQPCAGTRTGGWLRGIAAMVDRTPTGGGRACVASLALRSQHGRGQPCADTPHMRVQPQSAQHTHQQTSCDPAILLLRAGDVASSCVIILPSTTCFSLFGGKGCPARHEPPTKHT